MQQHLLSLFCVLILGCNVSVRAFHVFPDPLQCGNRHTCRGKGRSNLILSVVNGDNGRDVVPSSSSDEDKMLYKNLRQRHEEIQINKTRNALEEQHTQSFLKKRPVKLPYKQARKWVQMNLGVNTKEEFEDFVAMGYIQTPYIPKNPEQYYTRTRDWIDWNHFLNGSVAIDPRTGIFD